MKSSVLVVAAAVAALVPIQPSLAAEERLADPFRFYLGAGLGVSRLNPDTDGTIYDVEDSYSYGYKLTIGYDLTERISFEAYYADLGEADMKPNGTVEYKDLGMTGLYHFYRQEVGHRGWEAYGKAGLGWMKNDSRLNYDREHNAHLMVGIGGGYGFDNGLMLRADLDLFDKDSQFFSINLVKRFGAPENQPEPPRDEDGDGVSDEADLCPRTPHGTAVDGAGCAVVETPPKPSADSDGDGVLDDRDRCPGTPRGTKVDASGCVPPPSDGDQDGVTDNQDRCPHTPRGTAVDETGCEPPPPDTDGDGVPDSADRCPGTPPGTVVDEMGCEPPPPDSDGDGVPDAADRCPGTPPGTVVDEMGCEPPPPDSDGDGVPDAADRCPGTALGTVVDETGCPLPPPDGDRDGVVDAADRCPDTPPANRVDEHGCIIAELVLEGVKFEHDKDVLTATSRQILDAVAADLLHYQDPRSIRVVGHTDAVGAASYNQSLAQKRAEAVLAYLVGKGVDGGKLSAFGSGESQPIADNATAEGRELNRRVELVWE